MNTVLIQKSNIKFMRSAIVSSINNTNIIGLAINNNLYKTFYTTKPTHAIFDSNMINNEIIQFIQDLSDKIKCFIYHDSVSPETIKKFESYNVKHLLYNNTTIYNSICIPHNLINTNLFYNDNTIQKQDSIVCYLDNLPILPEFLKQYLYPKTQLPIKLFNNPHIQHYQNLGILNELDKAEVLRNHKYYLVIDESDQYIEEAKHCGCTIIYIKDIENYTSMQYIEPSIFVNFSTFFEENIL